MVTKGVSDNGRALLRQQWDDLVEVETMDSNDPDALALLGRPELGMTFTKLFAWQLTDYEKVCVTY
jgi:glycogenin glucosyltransferase